MKGKKENNCLNRQCQQQLANFFFSLLTFLLGFSCEEHYYNNALVNGSSSTVHRIILRKQLNLTILGFWQFLSECLTIQILKKLLFKVPCSSM